jgi:hypothetical protein
MSYIIETISHGEITGGFFGPFISYASFGRYAASRSAWRDFAVKLAGGVEGFDFVLFDKSGSDDGRLNSAEEMAKSSVGDSRAFGEARGSDLGDLCSDETAADLVEFGVEAKKARIIVKGKSVCVAEYKVSGYELCSFLFYVAKGGIFAEVDYDDECVSSMLRSKAGVFSKFNKEYRELHRNWEPFKIWLGKNSLR